MTGLLGAKQAVDGYEYDLFISYRRNGNVRDWMRNHFAPRLRECLVDELPREPRIFLDVELDVGTRWPDEIARALHRSHLLLAVWSPSYFTSHWCLAEWRTMRRREEILGLGELRNRSGLIYPIRFSDGDQFPLEAQNVTQEMSFKDWRLPYPQFVKSEKYLDFHQAVIDLAERLAPRFDDPPLWQPDWPVERPDPP
ncbi:MAG: toll/interleukin-1 receptor domain-containing protein, partial [Pseudonocardia sp.]